MSETDAREDDDRGDDVCPKCGGEMPPTSATA